MSKNTKMFHIGEFPDFQISVSYNPRFQKTAKILMDLAKQNNLSRSRLVRIITAFFKENSDYLKLIVEHYKPLVS